jgi:hypothetical protein
MDAYIFQAALYCEQCAQGIKDVRKINCGCCGGFHADIDYMDCRGFDQKTGEPRSESLYDSDDFPKGPYPDGGGEADSPQHCDSCNVFLENPLTPEGRSHVRRELADGAGDKAVLERWRDFYGMDDLEFGS